VSSLNAELKLSPGMTIEELKREVIRYEKRNFYEKTHFDKLTEDDALDFTTAGRYEEILEHIFVHKYYLNQKRADEIPFEAALYSWYENVYEPIILAIEELGLLSRFPGRTASDLYVYIVKYWDELKKKYGLSYPLTDAARGFSELYGESRFGRIELAIRRPLELLRGLFSKRKGAKGE
jgi:hypothetical protein